MPRFVAYSSHGGPGFPRVMDPRWEPDRLQTFEETISQEAHPDRLFVLDVESYQRHPKMSDSELEQSVGEMLKLLDSARAVLPGMRMGWYGVPARMPSGEHGPRYLELWRRAHDAEQTLVDALDFLCPSLYTFTSDPEAWVRYAAINIGEARRLAGPHKPVIPYIWDKYHPHVHMEPRELSGDYVSLQIAWVQEHCDGVCLWGFEDRDMAALFS